MTIVHWLVSTAAILVAAYLVPNTDVTLIGALVLAVVLALINIFLKPLITLLTLPLNIVTLGLFSLVVNAALIMLADLIVPGFSVGGFWMALLFAVVLSLINWLFSGLKRG
jgi:putative membrane protein